MDTKQFLLTTDQIAQAFGVTSKIISNNFNRNKDEFIEETHYLLLEGEQLKAVLFERTASEAVLSKRTASEEKFVSHLYFWTLQGAFEHAWILGSLQAKQAYEGFVKKANRLPEITLLAAQNSQLAGQNMRLLEQYTAQTRAFNAQKERVWQGSQSPDKDVKNKLLSDTDFQEILRVVRLVNIAALDMKRVKAISAADFRLLIERLERLRNVVEQQAAYEDEILESEVVDTQQQIVFDQRTIRKETQELQQVIREYQAMLPSAQQKQIESPEA